MPKDGKERYSSHLLQDPSYEPRQIKLVRHTSYTFLSTSTISPIPLETGWVHKSYIYHEKLYALRPQVDTLFTNIPAQMYRWAVGHFNICLLSFTPVCWCQWLIYNLNKVGYRRPWQPNSIFIWKTNKILSEPLKWLLKASGSSLGWILLIKTHLYKCYHRPQLSQWEMLVQAM